MSSSGCLALVVLLIPPGKIVVEKLGSLDEEGEDEEQSYLVVEIDQLGHLEQHLGLVRKCGS